MGEDIQAAAVKSAQMYCNRRPWAGNPIVPLHATPERAPLNTGPYRSFPQNVLRLESEND